MKNEYDVRYVIIDCSPVSHIDTSALHQLDYMVENYRSREQQIIFVNPSMRVMQLLVKSGFVKRCGEEFVFASLHDAVNYCLTSLDEAAISIHEGSIDMNMRESDEENPPVPTTTVSKESALVTPDDNKATKGEAMSE